MLIGVMNKSLVYPILNLKIGVIDFIVAAFIAVCILNIINAQDGRSNN